jgi:hypothetical protein
MAEEKKRGEAEAKTKEISLVWESAEELPTSYANQIIISHSGPEFYLIFGEVITPAQQGQLGGTPDELKVKPTVKIAISHSMMIEIAGVIAENVKKFLEKTKPV